MSTQLPANLPKEDDVQEKFHEKLEQLDRQLRPIEKNPKQRAKIINVVAAQVTATIKSHIGPLPSPESLAHYDQILPGTAERIIAMAEKQSDHRMKLEKKVIGGQLADSRLGQIFGLGIALSFLYVAYQLGMNNHDWLGGVIGGSTLIGLVSVFVYGKKKQDENLQSKK